MSLYPYPIVSGYTELRKFVCVLNINKNYIAVLVRIRIPSRARVYVIELRERQGLFYAGVCAFDAGAMSATT